MASQLLPHKAITQVKSAKGRSGKGSATDSSDQIRMLLRIKRCLAYQAGQAIEGSLQEFGMPAEIQEVHNLAGCDANLCSREGSHAAIIQNAACSGQSRC